MVPADATYCVLTAASTESTNDGNYYTCLTHIQLDVMVAEGVELVFEETSNFAGRIVVITNMNKQTTTGSCL